LQIGGQSFKETEISSGKSHEGSIAFKIVSAHPAGFQIRTDLMDSKLNYLSAVQPDLNVKSESLEFCIWLGGADCKRYAVTFGIV